MALSLQQGVREELCDDAAQLVAGDSDALQVAAKSELVRRSRCWLACGASLAAYSRCCLVCDKQR